MPFASGKSGPSTVSEVKLDYSRLASFTSWQILYHWATWETWTAMRSSQRIDKEDMVHIHYWVMEYYSAIKKNEIMPFAATKMDLDIVILSEVRQRINIIWYPLYVKSKKKWYKWTYLQNRTRHILREWIYEIIVAGGKEKGKGYLGSSRCTCTYCCI